MSQAPGKARIMKMLLKLPAEKPNAPAVENCIDMNWLEPHCFNKEQFEKINKFAAELAEKIKARLRKYYGKGMTVELQTLSQFFCKPAAPAENNPVNYCLGFSDEPGSVFGHIEIPQPTALFWTRQILADESDTQGPDVQISALERSLLHDVAAEVINALAMSAPQTKIRPQGCITEDLAAMKFIPGQEVCKLSFKFAIENKPNEYGFSCLMLCDHLTDVILADAASKTIMDPAKRKEAIAYNIKNIEIPISSILCTQTFSLGELLSLDVDDILVFNKKTSEPIDVLVDNRPLFTATLAKSDKNYAVIINKSKNNK